MAITDEILRILTAEMGPAARPFLERQCRFHLGSTPAELDGSKLEALSHWVKIGAGIALGEPTGEKLARQILALKDGHGAGRTLALWNRQPRPREGG